MTTNSFPLSGSIPKDIPLERSPLVRVLAQVRYAPILAVNSPEKVAIFQELIKESYPLLKQEMTQQFTVANGETPTFQQETIWRFSDRDNNWRISLNQGFLALESKAYSSRGDFIKRWQDTLTIMQRVFSPSDVSRLGIRYINRVTEEGFDKISDMVRPEISGIVGMEGEVSSQAKHIFTDALFEAKEGRIQVKWGQLPKGASHDDSLEPIPASSWILDFDMYNKPSSSNFVSEDLAKMSEEFAGRIYALFHWMVKKEFLEFYGGAS